MVAWGREMAKILITGTTTYSDNRGVSAMAAGTVKILKKHVPDAKIVIWHSEVCRRSAPTTYETDVKVIKERSAYGYFLKIPFRLFFCALWAALRKLGDAKILMSEKVLREYRDADLIISLNYGDGFANIYGLVESFSIFSQNLLNDLSKKPVVFFPQSIGPFDSGLTRTLARSVLNKSKLIMVREHITKKYLKEIRVKENLVHFVPDTAFLLEPADDRRVKKILSNEGLRADLKIKARPIIGISVNPAIAQFAKVPERRELYLGTMAKLVDYLVKNLNAVVIFVPNVTLAKGFDTRSLGNLIRERTEHKDSVVSINGDYTAEELKGVIKQCDLFIGSLMHTVIASISMNIPSVAIAYSHKASGIMESVGLGDYVIHFRDLSFDSLVAKTRKAWVNRDKIKRDLAPKTRKAKEQLLASGKLVKDLLS